MGLSLTPKVDSQELVAFLYDLRPHDITANMGVLKAYPGISLIHGSHTEPRNFLALLLQGRSSNSHEAGSKCLSRALDGFSSTGLVKPAESKSH